MNLLVYLAGLINVPSEVKEAAKLEGATLANFLQDRASPDKDSGKNKFNHDNHNSITGIPNGYTSY